MHSNNNQGDKSLRTIKYLILIIPNDMTPLQIRLCLWYPRIPLCCTDRRSELNIVRPIIVIVRDLSVSPGCGV